MKKLLLTVFVVCLSALGFSQSAWSGKFAYDFTANKPFALVSYTNVSTYNFLPNPQFVVSSISIAGSYVGSAGVGAGEGVQVSWLPQGKAFGLSLKGLEVDAAAAMAAFTGAKPHPIFFFGGSVSTGFIGQIFK